jgi:hypothetical protein
MPQKRDLPTEPPRPAVTPSSGGVPAPRKKRASSDRNVPRPEGPVDRADEENDGPDPLAELLRQGAKAAGPGFALSLVLHVAVLAVLGFVVMKRERQREFPTVLSGFNFREGSQGRRKVIAPVEVEGVKIEPAEVATGPRKKAVAEKPEGDPNAGVRNPSEVNVAGALAARGSGGTGGGAAGAGREGLSAQGGNEKSESAVSTGLAWLSRQQQSDGHWELHQGYPDAGQIRTNTGATALALLAFQGAGHTHRDGPYKQKLEKGINWLLGVQKKEGSLKGDFYDYDREGDAASYYAHGQATIALCEAFALTRDERLLKPIHDALAFIYEAQHPVTGGWKYRRHSEGDLSVFGWQIMALQTARMAGIEVPQNVLEKAAAFLDLVQEQNGSRYRYEPQETKSATPAMTAEGLMCRQYLGWPRDHPAMQAGVKYLLEPDNLPSWSSGRRNIYHWYYAAQVLHNLQGPEWEEWNAAMRDELTRNQAKGGGKAGGSWNPFQPAGAIDENSDKGGRLYVTCLALLTLEVYYRHLPLYGDAPADATAGP